MRTSQLGCSIFHDASWTYVAGLKDPRRLAVLVDLVPIAETDERASGDVLTRTRRARVNSEARSFDATARRTRVFQKSIDRRTTTTTIW